MTDDAGAPAGAGEYDPRHGLRVVENLTSGSDVVHGMHQISGYEDWLYELGLSSNTIKQRLEFVDRQLRAWGSFDVSARDIISWLSGYDGWTKLTYYNHAKSVFTFLADTGARADNPMARMRRPQQPEPHPKPLTQDQVRLVLEESSGDVRTWLLLAYLAGLRAHEIAKIRGEHVSPAALRVVGKGGKDVSLPTHPVLWEVGRAYPRHGFWFPSETRACGHMAGNAISLRIGRFFKSLGIQERGAIHRLRHSYCTQLSRNGHAPPVIQKLMRHSSLVTTQMYIDVTSDEKRAAIESLVA